MGKLNRRDFLKLSGALAGGSILSPLSAYAGRSGDGQKPNILVFVFDAMSARHLSIYGYERKTTPNFERFARRATVYHANYAGANFTVPGTATLFTGLYPWKHRAISLGGLIARERAGANIFGLMGEEYFRVGFSQNVWVNNLLRQVGADLEWQLPPDSFSLAPKQVLYSAKAPADSLMAYFAFDDYIGRSRPVVNPMPGSISLGFLDMMVADAQKKKKMPTDEFPYGIPNNSYYFYYDNRTVFSGVGQALKDHKEDAPLLGYFHFYSPHTPYSPHRDFVGIFEDMPFRRKPRHPLSQSRYSNKEMKASRDRYDEYVANVDAEFGRLLDTLEKDGFLKNSYVVVASDHGEVFERDEIGHGTALLYEGVIHTPLIISAPGQEERTDVHAPTCNTDLLPTFLNLAGRELPADLDGRLLPGLGGEEDPERPLFMLEAKQSSSFAALDAASVALRRGRYKLIHYAGYPRYDGKFELFDLQEDPHELHDLYAQGPGAAGSMKEELLQAFEDANRPYLKR